MRSIAAGTMVVLGLVFAPAAGAADLPVGSAGGVTLKQSKASLRVSFGPKARAAYRQIAGRRAKVSCRTVEKEPSGYTAGNETFQTLRVSKRRRAFRARIPTRGSDLCFVIRPRIVKKRGKGSFDAFSAKEVAAVPLTQAGAVYLDERAIAARVFAVADAAVQKAKRQKGRVPTFAELQRFGNEDSLRQLADPAGVPPAGTVGYYSDGVANASAVAVTKSGRRVYAEIGPDGRLATNLIVYLTAAGD